MKLTMLVCCHKEDIMATAEPYMPLQVGKDISKIDLNIQGDNTGDNISCKNQSYCELTGMYWAWKNLKNVDYVGLCHYRRYFDFHGQCKRGFPITVFPTKDFYKMDLGVPARILKQLQTGIIIMPKGINYDCSLFMNYCYAHVSDDLRTLEAVIHETQPPIYREAFNYIMRSSHVLKHFNMFIMSWTEFENIVVGCFHS